ncbi:MAG: type I-A CRISPR-associated protein Cas4/Csa1 [Thermofilaceae archaeon]|nr:type I-A CRISPR-associated protein Cas4/Csa1 [Thermofilaceae archaeon]
MLGRSAILRSLRRLHKLRERDPVEEEYRGWNWDKPPLKPRAYLGLGVSEVAYRYCETRRDVYLRRMGVEGRAAQPLIEGSLLHSVFNAAACDVRRELTLGKRGWEAYESIASRAGERLSKLGVDGEKCSWLLDFYKGVVLSWCAEEWALVFTEYRVDGSLLGLSRNLRVDGLVEGGLILELKYGRLQSFHQLSLAGYALALESSLEIPVDYGVLVYVSCNGQLQVNWEPVYVSTNLRREFIESRDELIDLLVSGREPPKAPNCPESCPFKGVCP